MAAPLKPASAPGPARPGPDQESQVTRHRHGDIFTFGQAGHGTCSHIWNYGAAPSPPGRVSGWPASLARAGRQRSTAHRQPGWAQALTGPSRVRAASATSESFRPGPVVLVCFASESGRLPCCLHCSGAGAAASQLTAISPLAPPPLARAGQSLSAFGIGP